MCMCPQWMQEAIQRKLSHSLQTREMTRRVIRDTNFSKATQDLSALKTMQDS